MKFKLKIKRTLKIPKEILEKKIDNYLMINSYRIIERGSGYVIFTEDEFSDRKKYRSDFHTRIGEGKFVFVNSSETEVNLELIYLTSASYYIFLVILFSAFGIYVSNFIGPLIASFAFGIPILWRIFYLNEHVFDEIIKC